MRGEELQFNKTFHIVTETCCACGVLFGMEERYRQQRLTDHALFYCPNGHPQNYTGKSHKEQLAEAEAKLKAAEARRQLAENSLRVEREAAKEAVEKERKAHAATKAKLKRTHHGVCPECQRQFKDMQRHMENKHPHLVGRPSGQPT